MKFPYTTITQFNQEAVGDEMGDTDWVLTKFDIQCQAVLNFDLLELIAPDLLNNGVPVTQNPATIAKVIRARLLERRRTLSIKFNDVELMPIKIGVGTVDAKNGPKPINCNYTLLTNTTYLFTYHIMAHYWESNQVSPTGSTIVTNKVGNKVLWNRWSETVDIDDANFTTRTREGKFVIRSDNQSGVIADQIRTQLSVLSVPRGFIRQGSHYTVSPDGLGISYRITDKEQFNMPPKPAFRAEGSYFESTVRFGAFRTGQVTLRLWGDKGTSQAQLVETGIAVATSKLKTRSQQVFAHAVNAGEAIAANNSIVESASVRCSLYDKNEVEVVVRAMFPATPTRYQGLAAFAGMSDVVPGSRSDYTPGYLIRGSASLLLQAAAYYDPALNSQPFYEGTDTQTANNLQFQGSQLTRRAIRTRGQQAGTVGLAVGRAGVNAEQSKHGGQ